MIAEKRLVQPLQTSSVLLATHTQISTFQPFHIVGVCIQVTHHEIEHHTVAGNIRRVQQCQQQTVGLIMPPLPVTYVGHIDGIARHHLVKSETGVYVVRFLYVFQPLVQFAYEIQTRTDVYIRRRQHRRVAEPLVKASFLVDISVRLRATRMTYLPVKRPQPEKFIRELCGICHRESTPHHLHGRVGHVLPLKHTPAPIILTESAHVGRGCHGSQTFKLRHHRKQAVGGQIIIKSVFKP